jgi:hypothetical protein
MILEKLYCLLIVYLMSYCRMTKNIELEKSGCGVFWDTLAGMY